MTTPNSVERQRTRVGVPRAGASPAMSVGLALVALALGPVCVLTGAFTTIVVVNQSRWHWWRWLIGGLSGALCSIVTELITGVNPVAMHLSGLGALWTGSDHVDLGMVLAVLVPTSWLGVPAGVCIGAAFVGVGEARATGAEWHPLEQRRVSVGSEALAARFERLLEDRATQARCSSSPLGVAYEGDLPEWREGPFVVVPAATANLGLAVIGASGSGKTVTLSRLITVCAERGRRVVFADCKGTDPDLAGRIVSGYLAGAGERQVRVLSWPHQPVDGWRGSPSDVANRLLALQDFTEPYYKSATQTAVRLAVNVSDAVAGGPCSSADAFLSRLTPEVLKRAYRGTRDADLASVVRRPDVLDGIRMRYAGFFDALAGRFDGDVSYEDAELTIVSVPTLAGKEDASAAMRMLLADFGHYAAARKKRRGDDVTLIVDEFSAVTDAAPLVIDLAERIRDVGGQVIVATQSYEGLGDDEFGCRRMVGALAGGLILHQLADPDALLKSAGTFRKAEQSWQLEDVVHSGMGSMRMAYAMRIEADAVRQAKVGEAWVIAGGRAQHMRVIAVAHAPQHQLLAAQLLADGISNDEQVESEATPGLVGRESSLPATFDDLDPAAEDRPDGAQT